MSEKFQITVPTQQEKQTADRIWDIVNRLQKELENPKTKNSPIKWAEKILELKKNAALLLAWGQIDTQQYKEMTEINPVKK